MPRRCCPSCFRAGDAGRLARRRHRLASRGDVAAVRRRAGLSRLWPAERPFPARFPADLAARGVGRDLAAALTFRLHHRSDATTPCSGCSTSAWSSAIVLAVATGLSIWKPVQLGWLTWVFGGYDIARRIHFVADGGIVAFLVVHLALVAIFPPTLLAMLTGGRRAPTREAAARTRCRRPCSSTRSCAGTLGALERRLSAERAVARGAHPADRLRPLRARPDRPGAVGHAALQRSGAGGAVQPAPPRRTFPPSAITRPFRFNAYYPE